MQTRNLTRATLGLAVLSVAACLGGGTSTQTQTASDTKAAAAPGTPAPKGKLVVWDGEQKASGKEWASCSKKGDCIAKLELDPKGGRSGTGLKFQAEGSDWIGFGWNWHGWHPDTAGDNIAKYKNLSFWIRVEAKSPAEAPDPKSLQVWLSCSCKEKKEDERSTAQVKIADFTKEDITDGEWHEVVIPVDEFFKDKGAGFDKSTAWEFDLGTWAEDKRNFTIYVDEIGFDNRQTTGAG